MRVSKPLLQLPIRFDGERLAAEVNALPPSAWCPHPQGYIGNEAVPLVSLGGTINDDFVGPMAPTENLEHCPYIASVMKELDGVWGRSRLMGLAAGANVPRHNDLHYYWRTHLRIHVPVITNPGVVFTVGGDSVHMAAGDCWVFDSFTPHEVRNTGSERRVHMVLDTVGSERLWDLVDQAESGAEAGDVAEPPPATPEELRYEQLNSPIVMSPWEIRQHFDFILEHALPHPDLEAIRKRLDRFAIAWRAAWAQFGNSDAGIPTYHLLIERVRADLNALGAERIKLDKQVTLLRTVEAFVFSNTLNPSAGMKGPARTIEREGGGTQDAAEEYRSRIERPIFLVNSPRSGSTVLFDTLAQSPGLYSPGGESHGLIEGIETLSVQGRGWSSNRLSAEDASPRTAEQLARSFYLSLRDRDGNPAVGHARMLEKTPKNALRVDFFNEIWPDATFVFLYRDPRQTMASMIEAWTSGRFRTYRMLPGWTGHPWSMLLVPGWRELNGLPLREIVARQWKATMEILLDDLAGIPPERLRAVDYDEFVASPRSVVEQLAASLELEWDRSVDTLPISKTTVSRPGRDKWRRMEDVINDVWPIVAEVDERARAFVESIRGQPHIRAA